MDTPYTARQEFTLAALLKRVGWFMLLVPLTLAALPFIAVAALVFSFLPGKGLASSVGSQVLGFLLTRSLVSRRPDLPVRDVRVRDGAGDEHLVRVRGTFTHGNLNVGDDVLIEGVDRGGTVELRRGFNFRTASHVRLREQ